ncbi:helix-turn-helix domain-containing protein [Actinomadura fulvescens]|uniref:Helix-turn-helix domain-containing protein n=1 Tax=Actinomadura fulvescens TaxID=46160 RepID=A0ABP6CWC5_9ACTN
MSTNQLPPRRRIKGEDRRSAASAFVSRYESGLSVRALASESGRSYGFVYKLLQENGAAMRGRGGPNHRGRGAADYDDPELNSDNPE